MKEFFNILVFLILLAFGIFLNDILDVLPKGHGGRILIGMSYFIITVFLFVKGFTEAKGSWLKLSFLILLATLIGLIFLQKFVGPMFGGGVLS